MELDLAATQADIKDETVKEEGEGAPPGTAYPGDGTAYPGDGTAWPGDGSAYPGNGTVYPGFKNC